jgi:hypothetical protein
MTTTMMMVEITMKQMQPGVGPVRLADHLMMMMMMMMMMMTMTKEPLLMQPTQTTHGFD